MSSTSYSSMLQKNSDVMSHKQNINKNESVQDNDRVSDYIEKNPKIVTKYEIQDFFDIKCSQIIDDCFYSIKSDCEYDANGILANEEYSSFFDFHELIRNNVDLTHFYKKHLDT